ALEAEAGAPDEERVRRCAVAFVGTVVRIHVTIGLDLKGAVRALDEEVLAIPTRGQGELAGLGRRLLGGVERSIDTLGLRLDDGGVNHLRLAWSLLLHQTLHHPPEFLDGLLLGGHLVAQLLEFCLGRARGSRGWAGISGGRPSLITLREQGERTGSKKK